ncbi:MAG TPA: NINE protein [Tenuifilaceae bacterium]|nr:NINE protein [Tenuifilaceae bacterium]
MFFIPFPVGGFGIHRHYLGTKGSMWAIYFFTCGGIFGIVPMVDWIVILVDGILNKNIDKYTNNEKFFMWA